MNRTKKTPETVHKLVALVGSGMTLSRAAAAVGVHVATVCRWQAADPRLRGKLREADRAFRVACYAARLRRRPRVPWHPFCPACGSRAEVRRAWTDCFAFWRCSRWPWCDWASWRPRYLFDCPACRGPRYWSFSRKTVGCPRCQTRITTH